MLLVLTVSVFSFAIWNTMMGTSLLSMPWALEQAGLGLGLFLMLLVAGLCLYTAYRIIQVYQSHSQTHKVSKSDMSLETFLSC